MKTDKKQLEARRDAIGAVLRKLGIARVVVRYDGQGDSGQIEEVEAFNADEQPIKLEGQTVAVEHFESAQNPKTKLWTEVVSVGLRNDDLDQALGEFAEDTLDFLECYYSDNEGGFGEVVITVGKKSVKVKAEHNDRVESSEYRAVSL